MAVYQVARRRGVGAAGLRLGLGSETLFGVSFALVFVVGFAARCHGVADKPFWIDEVTTIRRSMLGLPEMIRASLTFHQMPAYFVVTSWMLPFGVDEFWVRLPAMLFGALSCALAFGVARTLGGMAAGLAAGLLVAFSPPMVQYGQEARSYTMMMCAILVALWGLVVLARDPAWAAKGFRDGPGLAWAAYGFGTIAALNVLSDALPWLLASNLAAPAIGRQSGAGQAGFWRNWLIVQLAIFATCAPWFAAMAAVGTGGAMGGLDWVPAMTWHRLWWAISGDYFGFVTSVVTDRIFAPGVPGLGFAVAAAGVAGLAALRRQNAVLAVLAAAALALPVTILAVSAFTPMLMPRYLLWGTLPVYIGAGVTLGRLPARAQLPALAALGFLAVANLAPYYQDEIKPRWDLAAQDLRDGWRPGDLVLTGNAQEIEMLNLYCRGGAGFRRVPAWTLRVPAAARWRAAGRRVWAVQGVFGQADKLSERQFVAALAGWGKPDLVERAGYDILIMRFNGDGS